MVATILPSERPAWAVAADPGVTCDRTWVGSVTGVASWALDANWSPATAPLPTDAVCFGADHGGTAVAGVRVDLGGTVQIAGFATDAAATITLAGGTLTVTGDASIDGVTLDGIELALQTPTTLGSGATAGGRGLITGDVTVAAGATISADELVFQGDVVNDGAIVGVRPLTAQGGSLVEFDAGTYRGTGTLTAPALQLSSGSVVEPDPGAPVTIGTATIDATSTLTLHAASATTVVVIGRLRVGPTVSVRHLLLEQSAWMTMLGGSVFEPTSMRAVGDVLVDGVGTVRPDTLEVELAFVGGGALRRPASATAVAAAAVARSSGLVRVDDAAGAAGAAAPLAVSPVDADGLTIAGGVELVSEPNGTVDIAGDAGISQLDTSAVDLSGTITWDLTVLSMMPFRSVGTGRTLSIDGCLVVNADREYFTGTGPVLASVDGGDAFITPTVVSATPPTADARWVIERTETVHSQLQRAGLGGVAALAAEQATYQLVSRLGDPNPTSCDLPVGDVRVVSDAVDVPEGGDPVEVTITVDNTTGAPATLTPSLTGTGAQPLEADDVSVSPATFDAPVGTSTQVLRFVPNGDGVYETDETGEIGFGAAVAGSIAVTVVDDEQRPTIVAVDGLPSVSEGDPIVLTPVASGPTEVPVSVSYTVEERSGDITDVVGLGLFGVVGTDEPLQFVTVDDGIPEGDETLRLTIGAALVDVVIREDDGLGDGIELVAPTEPTAEGSTAHVELRFPTPTPGGVTFSWSAEQDSLSPVDRRALFGVDFAPEVHPLVLVDRNQLVVDLAVPVVADAEVEGEETFVVEVQIDGMIQPLRASVTIAADPVVEPLTMTLSPLPSEVREGQGDMPVELVVTGTVPGGEIYVPVTATTNGDVPDFASGAGFLVTGPGTYRANIFVYDDEDVEGAEPFVVRLGDPIPAADVTYVVRERSGIVFDDDEAVQPVEVAVAFGGDRIVTEATEGATVPLRVLGDTAVPGSLVVTIELAGVTQAPLGAADPATDVRLDGTTPTGPPFLVEVALPEAPVDHVDLPLALVDDSLVEGTELLEARIVGLTVDGAPRAFNDLAGPTQLSLLDDDTAAPIGVAVAFGAGGSTDEPEGATTSLRVLGDDTVDGTIAVTVEFVGVDERGLVAADAARDVQVDGAALTGPPFRRTIVLPAAGTADVPVVLVEDADVEPDELLEVRIVAVTVDGAPRSFDAVSDAAQLTILDDDGPVAVQVAVEPSSATEGATVQLHTTGGVNRLDGPVAVTVEFSGPTSDLLGAGDPALDIRVDGAALPANRRITFLVPKSPTQDVRVPILLVDDPIAEEIETLEARVVAVSVDGAPRTFTPTDQVAEIVITDNDDAVDEQREAEQVDAFRTGMLDLPDLLGSWAGLFDFTPGAWDGADPVDLPVGEDRLATLAEVGPAVASATRAVPVPSSTDSTWDRVVQRLTDPDDDGTPHEPGEGACDIVHVVRGIGGAPDAPADGIIEVRCDLTLGELLERANGGTLDQSGDEDELLGDLATLLALDADDGLQLEMTVQLVFGLDTQSFYVKATTGLDAHLHGEIHLTGSGTVLGVEGVDVSGDGRIDAHLRLGPEGNGKLRDTQLATPPSELLRPEVQGTASADLEFVRDDDSFEWHADWRLQTPTGADPLVELTEQRLSMALRVKGLETGVVDRPDSVLVEGVFANGVWTLTGSLDDAAINGFVLDHAEFTAVVDAAGVFSAEADVDLVINEATDDPVEVAVHWERTRDTWSMTGTVPLGDLFVKRLLYATGAEVVVNLGHDGTNPTGSVTLTADTAVVFPVVGEGDPEVLPGGAPFTPRGLLTLTEVRGTIVPGGVSLHAATAAASIRGGAVSFTASDVDVHLGSAFADRPALSIAEVAATFRAMPTTLVTVTGLQVLQDGRVGAVSAEVDRADGFFDGSGLDDVLPFSVTNVRLEFTDTVPGTDPPLRALDAFDVIVTGSFDQDEMAEWPFSPQIQLGGEVVTPTSDPDANSFTFSVSVESLADGVIRPLDLGPIGFGFDGVQVGRSELDGFISFDGWVDGELQPGLTGELVLARGVDTEDESSKRATISGTMAPGRVDIDAEFAITGRYGNLTVRDLALAFSMQFGLDATGDTYATVDLQTLSVGESSLVLGPWARVTLGDASFDFDAAADEPALVVLGDPSDPTSGLGVEFLAEIPELEGWGGRIGGITVCGDGSIHLTEQTFVTLRVPEGEQMGLPDELPVRVDEAGIIFDLPAPDPAAPCTGGDISDISDVVVRFSGGVEATPTWPLSFDIDGLEVSLGRLIGAQPGFPIVNLDEITIGMEPQEFGAGVTLGGQLTLGQVPVDGENVFYLQVQGSVGVSGIEFGGNVVVTQYGPVIMALQAPVGIPIGPTGLVISSVAAGVQFGVELPSIDDPIDLLGLPISPVDASVDRQAIIDAIRPVIGGGALWDRPFSIAGTGFITSVASPGMAGGEVTFGMNIGFRPGDGVKLFARGDLTAFGIPVGGGGIFIDLASPVEPVIDVAFQVPGPQAGPISFVMPSEGTFTMRIDTTGVAPAAAIAIRTFVAEVANGTVEIGSAAFSQALDALAAELDQARHRPLAQYLLDVDGDGVVSPSEDATTLTSGVVVARLLALLPSSPGEAAALLATDPDLVTAVIGELLIALDGVSVGGEVPADLLAAFGAGQRTMAAFVAMVSQALRNAGAAALEVFDPSVTITGSIQPMILGIPFGEPEAAGTLTINRDGITAGYSISISKLVQRLNEMIVPFVGGELTTLLSAGFVDTFDFTAQLPVGGFVESLVTGTVAPRIDPNDGRWAIRGRGRIGLLGYEMAGTDMVITAPQNQRFVDQQVQRLFDPVTGEPLDISPVQIDPEKIPIVTKADYDNLLKYGGILISGRMQVPGMIVDPVTLISQIGPVPTDPAGALPWLRQVAETVSAPATPIRGTLFLPSPQILLTQQLDAIGDDRFSVNTAAATFVDDARQWLRAASFNGVYEGMFMSIPAYKATVRGTVTGLSITGTVPLIGARATFQVAMRDQQFAGGVVLPIPTVELRASIDPTSEGSLLNRLGVPADFEFVSGSLEVRILSPGFDPSSADAFERQGGVRVTARANVAGIVDGAEVIVAVLTPSNPLAGEDYDIEVRADQLGIVGFGITEPELVFRKRGLVITGELHGRAMVLGAAASVDGTFDSTTGGSLAITFDSGAGPTISGFNLSAAATLELTRRPNAAGFDVAVSFTGEARLPSWLSNASGRATATVSGCLDPDGDAEFVVSLAELGFGALLPNGQRRVTIGARVGQSAGQPAAACTLPAGATVTPGGAVVRLRSAGGVSSVFVDGQMRFNDPLMVMPNVGVTGSFDSTGVGTLTVSGSLNLLGSTLTIGSTVTVTRANGATGTLTLSTPPGRPLTLAGWAVGGTLSLTLSATAATAGIAGGTLTVPGAGTFGITGSIATSGEGSFAVTLPVGGMRLGPSPSPFFATGTFRIAFAGGVGTFTATNASLQMRNGGTTIATFPVPLFSVGTDGTLAVDTPSFTFEGPDGVGGFSLVIPSVSLRSGAAMSSVRLELGAGTLTLPGLADGSAGRPRLTTPAFTFDSTLDVERVLAAGSLNLGTSTLTGRLVLVGADGVFSVRVEGLTAGQPARLELGALGGIDLDEFVIAANGTFSVSGSVAQLGPSALSIRNASFTMSKTGAALTSFSASITGGQVLLPMGNPITLPTLSFDASSRIDRTFTVPGVVLGAALSTSSAVIRVQQLSSGVLQLAVTNAPAVSALAGSVGLVLHDFLVESDGTFSGTVTGRIALFGTPINSSATLQVARVGGVVRLRLPASDPARLNLGFATLSISGDAFSDGRFDFTGSVPIDVNIAIARLTGSVSVTVADSGVTGSYAGTACVLAFTCVSASGAMSSTGFVESQVRVDTNFNGIPDTNFDVDFQIGAAPGGADTTRPSMAVPASVSVTADIPAGRTTARVHYTTPTATDAGGTVAVVCTPASGTDFAVGTTTVTCRATDRAGNERTRTFTVTVIDSSPTPTPIPQLVAGAAVTQTGSGFAASSVVQLVMHSDPVLLGVGIADATGSVTVSATIPADAAVGEHTLMLLGEGPDGEPVIVSRPIEVLATAVEPGTSTTVPTATSVPPATPTSTIPSTTATSTPTATSVPIGPATSVADDPATAAGGVGFVALAPARLLDTRELGGAPVAGGVTAVPVLGRAGVPADAVAVVLNVTVVDADRPGFATVFACGADAGPTSNINVVDRHPVPGMVTVAVGAGGAVCVRSSMRAHLVVDVSGAYGVVSSPLVLVPVGPTRIADTRDAGGQRHPAGGVTQLRVTRLAGVPADAQALVVNVTLDGAAADGFATVYPCGGPVPLASHVNVLAGTTASNAATVQVSAAGTVCVYTSVATDVVVDVLGAFVPGPGGGVVTAADRVLDTRLPGGGGAFGVGEVRRVRVGSPRSAVVLNVVLDEPASDGFATVFPCEAGRPTASNINVVAGTTRANSLTVATDAAGEVCVFTSVRAHVVIDRQAVMDLHRTDAG
jgi:hypothetical protein